MYTSSSALISAIRIGHWNSNFAASLAATHNPQRCWTPVRLRTSRSDETAKVSTHAIECGVSMASTIVATDAAFPITSAKNAALWPYPASMSPKRGGTTLASSCADNESCVKKLCLGSK